MVTENGVRAAADRIRARAAPIGGVRERVSVRTVRKELGKGSFTDIARALAKWRDAARYDPVVERADLPEAFGRRLATLGKEILELARVEATRERLSDLVAEEDGRAQERNLLDEALDRVELLEGQVASLQAELDRSRGAVPAAAAAPAATTDPAPRAGPPTGLGGMVGALMGKSLARDADAFWEEVRQAVEAAMPRDRAVAVHELHRSLPAALKTRGERIGMPLTAAWLRYHLLREAEAGRGVAEAEGRFVRVVEAQPPDVPAPPAVAPADPVPPRLSARRFWILFVAEVHDLLLERGPLSVDDILTKLPAEWVEATARFGSSTPRRPIRAGKLREKLRGRIAKGRPLRERDDRRFEATGRWPGSRTLDDEEAA